MSKKTLVFGMGTGRCGTTSLAKLLNSQENAFVGHELFPILPWKQDFNILNYRLGQLEHQAHADLIGDVGMYYLPYAETIINSSLIERFNIKFISLRRNKDKTVSSFLKKVEGNNPFQIHDGTKWAHYLWDIAFPKYDSNLTMKGACEKYWEDYYLYLSELEQKYPKYFKTFETNELNSIQGVKSILSFLDIDNPVIIDNIKINMTK